jgi:transposase
MFSGVFCACLPIRRGPPMGDCPTEPLRPQFDRRLRLEFHGATVTSKEQRYRQQSWSFFQLRSFIDYKAQSAGVPVILVDPAYTSKTCHSCGELGYRDALLFSCPTCGAFDADKNAALNIAARGALVTAPELARVRP